jgi:hypothetical protein
MKTLNVIFPIEWDSQKFFVHSIGVEHMWNEPWSGREKKRAVDQQPILIGELSNKPRVLI